jgi:hypothetical protein
MIRSAEFSGTSRSTTNGASQKSTSDFILQFAEHTPTNNTQHGQQFMIAMLVRILPANALH